MKTPVEDAIRKQLPVIRFLQEVMPPGITNPILKRAVGHARLSEGTSLEPIMVHDVPCTWIVPEECSTKEVLIYLHGGGFVLGMTPRHLHMVARVARKMKIRALMVDYRLAPKHPFPAAVEDCTSVYTRLLDQGFHADDIVIAGDSAGGNLTLTTLIHLRQSGHPLPAAATCLSPVVNLTPDANRREGFRDPLLSPKVIEYYNSSYLGQNDAVNPLISPVYADLAGLPPLLLHVGEDEVLRDEAVRFATLAEEAGVKAVCKVYPGMWHVWQIFPKLPQTARSLEEISEFLESHLE